MKQNKTTTSPWLSNVNLEIGNRHHTGKKNCDRPRERTERDEKTTEKLEHSRHEHQCAELGRSPIGTHSTEKTKQLLPSVLHVQESRNNAK
jgi:hypothetical protein